MSIYPVPNTTSGAEAVQNSQTQAVLAEQMIEAAMKTLSDPNASVADKFAAFQNLSGYINGTNSQYSALNSAYDKQLKTELNTATLNCLSQFNDVEIPVGKDSDGNTVYKRVYTDSDEKTPATAGDFVRAWENTGANGTTKTSFYFSFTSNDIDPNQDNSESWAGGTDASSMTPSACHNDGSDTYNPQKEAGGGVTVNEHTEYSGQQDMNCSGDAQAIAAYCNYNQMDASGKDVPNYDFQGAFNGFLAQAGWEQPTS